MATLTHEPRSFTQAQRWFEDHVGGKGSVRLGNATELYRTLGRGESGNQIECYAIALFGNEIVRFEPDGFTKYKTCGWITASTIDRLDAFTPARYGISGRNYTWRAKNRSDAHLLVTDRDTEEQYRFESFFVLGPSGHILEAE